MEQILSQFGVQPLLLAAQVVNFLILLFILNKVLYKPLLKVLEERKKRITESLENAAQIEQRLLKLEDDKEEVIIKATKEGQKIIDEATKNASQIVSEAKTDASKQVEELFEKGKESIRMEKEKMQQEIRSELATLVITAMQKVSGKAFNQKEKKELVEKAITEL